MISGSFAERDLQPQSSDAISPPYIGSGLAICSVFVYLCLSGKVLGVLIDSPNDCEHHAQVCCSVLQCVECVAVNVLKYMYSI